MPPLTPMANNGRWPLQQALLLVLSAILLLLVFENTGLDLAITRLLYDPVLATFPLRRHWLFDHVLHSGLKHAATVAVFASLYFCYRGWQGRLAWLPPRNALLAALGMLLIPIGTTVLKHLTNRHCPWDMVEFGGDLPYLTLLAHHPASLEAGQCFPAGHASAGFLWLVWAMALRPAGVKFARYGLLTGLVLGAVMGLSRMAQGAHFLSHTLWTLWFAWALSLTLALLLKADLRLGTVSSEAPPPRSGNQG